MRAKPASHASPPAERSAPRPEGGGVVPPAPRVLLCERDPAGVWPIDSALRSLGIEPVKCRDPRALLEEAVRRPPGVVICELLPCVSEDVAVLELFRRVAPAVPLILITAEGSLETRKLVLGLRPMYYMVGPVEAVELGEAVRAALSRR